MSDRIKVGIIGGAGYAAGELIRILVNHPNVEISFITSESHAGADVADIHSGLIGDIDMKFVKTPSFDDVDVVFLCMGHGKSRKTLASNEIRPETRIIDLAQDFRNEENGFVYGLPEINRNAVSESTRIANPGCFATAVQLALLPAAKAGIIEGETEVVALTGATGAGVKPSDTTHFSWRTDNISTYKEFTHQHLEEISRNLGFRPNFVPMRGDFARGIFVTAHFHSMASEDDAVEIYKRFYDDAPFTFVTERSIDLKQVVNTNKALVHVRKYGDIIHITCVIDNLLKGAAGQAVENMNLMFGLPEENGLKLKASAF